MIDESELVAGDSFVVVGEQPNIEILMEELEGVEGYGSSFALQRSDISNGDETLGNADLAQLGIDFLNAVLAAGTWEAIKFAIGEASRRGRVSLKKPKSPPESEA